MGWVLSSVKVLIHDSNILSLVQEFHNITFLPWCKYLCKSCWLLTMGAEWIISNISEYWFICKYKQNTKAVLCYDSQEPSAILFGISTHRINGHLFQNITSFCNFHTLSLFKEVLILLMEIQLVFWSFNSEFLKASRERKGTFKVMNFQ